MSDLSFWATRQLDEASGQQIRKLERLSIERISPPRSLIPQNTQCPGDISRNMHRTHVADCASST